MDNNQETKKGWLTANLEDWEFRRLYERELVAESFIVRIEDAMDEQKVTKTELAKRMECTSANISRAMRKTTNMTIATMVDMALSLNLRVRITLEPVAIGERAFASQEKSEATWPPKVEGTTNPEGFVVFFRVKPQAESSQCDASVSRALWPSKSAHETEASMQVLEPLFA